MKKEKKPWLAGILNVVLPGAGYLYNGKRKIFAYLLISSVIIGIGGSIVFKVETAYTSYDAIAGILFAIGLGYDAYCEAVQMNKKK